MNYAPGYATRQALSTAVRKTLTNTFIAVGAMWALTGVASYATLGWQMGIGSVLMLFVASLATLLGVFAMRNSAMGLVLLAVFSVLEGLSLGPLLNHYLNLRGGTQIVGMAAGLTALATFGVAVYCSVTQKSFSHLRGMLFAGLLLLIVAMLVTMFVPAVPAVHAAISGIAAAIFVGYMLLDISDIVTGQETNYIVGAVQVYLNMLNLFMHLLRLLSFFSSSDD